MRISKDLTIVILSVLPGVALGATPGGTLSGTVVDGNGAPMPGALVLYKSPRTITTAPNGSRVYSGPSLAAGVRTGAGGTFSVSGLPPETYNLCAYGPGPADLGSCEWGQGTTQISVTSGQTAQLTFQVAQGTLLTFQVQDPRQQIKSLEDLHSGNGGPALNGANFGIGVWVGSHYTRAAQVSAAGTTRQYQVAVPKTADALLYLDTSLAVLDATETPVPTSQQSKTIAPGGQAGVTIILTVP